MLRNKRSAFIAALMGVISLSPIALLPAQDAVLGQAVSGSQTVSTAVSSVIAGENSSASTAAAYLASPNQSTCSASTKVKGRTTSPATALPLDSVSGIQIGMVISTTTGIAAGTRVVGITAATNTITISPATTATINNNANLSFSGCYQSFFSVNNKGAIAVTSFGISQSVSTTAPYSITLQSCSGSWNEGTGTCSGSITNIVETVSGASAVIQVNTALAEGSGTVRLRALCNTNSQESTISITINSATNFRAGITSHS
jgi:hypothetical protein